LTAVSCSEMFVEGLLALFSADVLKRKVALLHAAFFIGSRSFYKALRDMPEAQLAKFQMTAVSYVNELYGAEAAKRRTRRNARFINDAMMATLMGDVISDGLGNGQVVSGVGGQYNFVSQAFALDDPRAIIVLRSKRSANGKTQSNILWNYPHHYSTTPSRHRHHGIWYRGFARQVGSRCDCSHACHNGFAISGDLLRQWKDAGKIEGAFDLPKAARENTPDTIEKALRPARDEGLLPPFPFGTDFTDVEQRLLPALQTLKAASPLQLAALIVQRRLLMSIKIALHEWG
jgi:hypothetical protein